MLKKIMLEISFLVISFDIEFQEKKFPIVSLNKFGNSNLNNDIINKVQSNLYKTQKFNILKNTQSSLSN